MKNILVTVSSVVIASIAFLSVVKYMAPGLLGLPVDLQLVQVDKKVPPFFDGVFSNKPSGDAFLIQDPHMGVRAKPFYPGAATIGPNDLLGFRNISIPTVADIVTIGDSQTYGNNVSIIDNWPHQMAKILGNSVIQYSMATGGWSAPQYLKMFRYATAFTPRITIIAFYTGNDPMGSYLMVYGSPYWSFLIPDSSMSIDDIPDFSGSWLAGENQDEGVVFSDGVRTIFTPRRRLKSNIDHPVIYAGYKIMSRVAVEISQEALGMNIVPVFTIIPTKELVYSRKAQHEGIKLSKNFNQLVQREESNIMSMKDAIQSIDGAHYIDVVTPLQNAAMGSKKLYPENRDGHPLVYGYRVIGQAIAEGIKPHLPVISNGLAAIRHDDSLNVFLLKDGIAYQFPDRQSLTENGWKEPQAISINERDLASFTIKKIETVNRKKYGPR